MGRLQWRQRSAENPRNALPHLGHGQRANRNPNMNTDAASANISSPIPKSLQYPPFVSLHAINGTTTKPTVALIAKISLFRYSLHADANLSDTRDSFLSCISTALLRFARLSGVRLWKFDAAAFQSWGNKNLLALRVGSRNPDGQLIRFLRVGLKVVTLPVPEHAVLRSSGENPNAVLAI